MLQEIKVSTRHFLPPLSPRQVSLFGSFASEPVSFLSGFHFSPLRFHIKPAWLSACCRRTIISLMWFSSRRASLFFFFFFSFFLLRSSFFFLSSPFLKSLDEQKPDENERPRRRPPAVPGEHAAKEGGRIYIYTCTCTCYMRRKIFLRVLVYMPPDFSRDSSFDIWPAEKCAGESDDYRHAELSVAWNFRDHVDFRRWYGCRRERTSRNFLKTKDFDRDHRTGSLDYTFYVWSVLKYFHRQGYSNLIL